MGERSLLSTSAALLARALHEQGRDDEAEALCQTSERLADEQDVITHVMWRGVRARILANRRPRAQTRRRSPATPSRSPSRPTS